MSPHFNYKLLPTLLIISQHMIAYLTWKEEYSLGNENGAQDKHGGGGGNRKKERERQRGQHQSREAQLVKWDFIGIPAILLCDLELVT